MNDNKVSIVIPVYNGRDYIKETISSCLSQDFSGEIEIVVIDDGSIEPACDIINSLANDNDNIRYYKNEVNRGLMYTNNFALTLINGEYVIFLGQDDILKKSHVKTLEKKLSHNSSAFVWCNSEVIDTKGDLVKVSLNDDLQILKTHFAKYFISKSNFISSTGLMMRVSSLKSVGGWPATFRNFGEWDLWSSLILNFDIEYCDEIYSKYRRHGKNISSFTEHDELPIDVAEYYSYCREKYLEKIKAKSILFKINLSLFNLLWRIIQRVK
ncbi:TPA: glycosyltransferase family 2 protein [Vibrio vulnificus]|nr:glycosyltransferase family 2 protein [Vibrio vulnificus]